MAHTIDGIPARTDLERGGEKFVQGSGKKPYVLKRHQDDAYSCSCASWAFVKGQPGDARSCKHLQELLSPEFERARVERAGGIFKEAGNKTTKKAAAKKTGATAPKAAGAGPSSSVLPEAPAVDKLPKETSAQSNKRKKEDEDEEARKKKAKVVKKTTKALPKKRGSKNDSPAVEVPDKSESDDAGAPNLMLAHKWAIDGSGVDPTGYWMSEKLDGVRGYWQARKGTIISRLGNAFKAPKWFTDKLPTDLDLDGELYLARGAFSEVNGVVKSHNSSRWTEVVFKVFDIPTSDLPFEDRLALLSARFGGADSPVLDGGKNSHFISGNATGKLSRANSRDDGVVQVVPHLLCTSREHVLSTLKEVVELEGEGLMLRKPKSIYKGTRTTDLLKVKIFFDAEARVTGYEQGKGKHAGVTGSLQCVMDSGKKFKVGSGMTDAQRAKPPPIGSIVRYRFFELSKDGVPRFPTFVGEAVDKKMPKDADVPTKRIAGSQEKEDD